MMKKSAYIFAWVIITILPVWLNAQGKLWPDGVDAKLEITSIEGTARLNWQINPKNIGNFDQLLVLWRKGNDPYTPITVLKSQSTWYIHTNVYPVLKQDYKIRAIQNKNTVFESNAVSIKGPASLPIRPPEKVGLRFDRKKHLAEISWKRSSNPFVVAVNVYARVGIDDKFQLINKKPLGLNDSSIQFQVKEKKQRHFFYVVYIDEFGKESAASEVLNFHPSKKQKVKKKYIIASANEAPSKPKWLKARFYHTYVRLFWPKQYDTNLKGFSVYQIKNGKEEKIASVPNNKTSYYVKGLSLNTVYQFSLKAYSEKKESAAAAVTIKTPPPEPSPVYNLDTEVTKKGVKITWDESVSPDGLKNIQFHIYYKPRLSENFIQYKGRVTRSPYVMRSPKKRGLYEVYVTAVNKYRQESKPCKPVFFYIK